ncbi:PilW family protein [Pseudoduganella armeniaca]|uniref:Pilus assembly protein PilW n=1 Tax=Pseudoduganella armeniaca TaxID=2072590 RepID=A0A2R4C9A5_9BURK|nr:PilW family protein [Pseudoduganella armeniaca]AVR96108.1 pilus assembly protein PilW [Pseudoduganella armeniaca]
MTVRRCCAGVGLAEMLVALVLGMLVALASAAMLASANGDFLVQGASARLNDGGRYALALLGQALRQAGYADPADPAGGGPPSAEEGAAIAGLDACSVSPTGPGLAAALPAAVNGSDALAVRFGGSGSGAGDGSVTDCAGFAVGARAQGWSIFYVARGDDGEAELRCKYRADSGGWRADAVVRGVDSFQVLYGLDTDTPGDGMANRFLNATAIDALDAALEPHGETAAERALDRSRRSHWHRVVTVRVALLLHGEAGMRDGARPLRYALFGDAYAAADPGTRIDEVALPAPLRARPRRLFETAVTVRNGGGP